MKFKKPLNLVEGERRQAKAILEHKPEVACEGCNKKLFVEELEKNYFVCNHCGNHFRISARNRIKNLIDSGTFIELDAELESKNFLGFMGYDAKLESGKKTSGENEAVIIGIGEINKNKVALFFMEHSFMMGSMGSVVGEKITRIFEYATAKKLHVVGFCLSGGARMQEGIVSLMQMAKTAGAVQMHNKAGLLFISVLTNPTTGGVNASFASLGDIIIAEPNALIGFAGPRVIEQTIRKTLPVGFQRSEFMQEHGFLDIICERVRQKQLLTDLLQMHCIKWFKTATCGALENDINEVSSNIKSKKASDNAANNSAVSIATNKATEKVTDGLSNGCHGANSGAENIRAKNIGAKKNGK